MNNTEFKQARIKLGLTQAKMGFLLGMSAQHISRLECGYEGRTPTIQQAASVFALEFLHAIGFLNAFIKRKEKLRP